MPTIQSIIGTPCSLFLNTHVVIQTVYKMVYRQKTKITLDMIFVRNVYMCNWYTIKAE